jgi:hypothetical protein
MKENVCKYMNNLLMRMSLIVYCYSEFDNENYHSRTLQFPLMFCEIIVRN